jgi:magnesium transporter
MRGELRVTSYRAADAAETLNNLDRDIVARVLEAMPVPAAVQILTGLTLGAILGVIGITRITLWQRIGLYDYGTYWLLVALTVGLALMAIVTFGSLTGSMLPFVLKRLGFHPATASAPFVATLVDVTGLVIYFSVAYLVLRGTLL